MCINEKHENNLNNELKKEGFSEERIQEKFLDRSSEEEVAEKPLVRTMICDESKSMKEFAPEALDAIVPVMSSGNLDKKTNEVSVGISQALVKNTVEESVDMPSTLNFDLTLLRKIIWVQDTENGEETSFRYFIRITVRTLNGGEKTFNKDVAGGHVKDTRWLKDATYSLATVPKGKDQIAEYEYKVQRCLETWDAPVEIIYCNAGWRNIPNVGWRYVYEDGLVGNADSLIHANCNGKYSLDVKNEELSKSSTFNAAMKMCAICKSEIASTELLLFVHATVLSELFEQANHPLNFAFGIMGVTNSRKTSLVTTMAQIFHRENLKVDAEFATATSCGIEKTLALYRDAPVLIDDFKPGVNRTKQAELDRKLDEVLRYAGNRVAKQRMTDFMPEGNKKYFPINGGIIMTMELVTGVLSSLTRMFLTEINADEVINERLQIYQEQKWILPTHLYDFLGWITENFSVVVSFISSQFSILRSRCVSEFGRYSEMYASLQVTAIIIGQYSKARGFWDDYQIAFFLNRSEEILIGEIRRMEARAKRRDKAELVREAFTDSIKKGLLVPIVLNHETSGGKYDVYENEKYYFARARKLRCLTNEYARINQEHVEIVNDDELIGLLERLNLLEVYERKDGSISRSRKLPIQKGNALCYLYVKKEKIWESKAL